MQNVDNFISRKHTRTAQLLFAWQPLLQLPDAACLRRRPDN